MAITKMKLVEITSNENYFEKILEKINDINYFHPEPASNVITEENEGALVEGDKRYAQNLNMLASMNQTFHFIDENTRYQEFKYEDIEEIISKIEPKFKSCEQQMQELATLSKEDLIALDKLRAYGFEVLNNLSYFQVSFGRIPINSAKKLEMFDIDNMIYEILYKNGQYYWILCITGQKYKEGTKNLLHSLFFEPIEIPKVDDKKIIEENKEVLSKIYCYLKRRVEIYDLYKYVMQKDDDFIVTGFVVANELDNLQKLLDDPLIKIKVLDLNENERLTPPTKLSNGIFSKPFEMFVDMYGTPHYGDIDPTMIVSITYCILFGIMFGDLGQGLVLFLGGYYFYKYKKMQLGGIVQRLGVFSMIFGVIYGSVFGNEELLTPLYTELLGFSHKPIHVLDPNFAMPLLIFACGLGFVFILMSISINIYLNIKRKQYVEAICSPNGVAGMIFYAGIVIMFVLEMTSQQLLGYQVKAFNLISDIFIIIIPLVLIMFKHPIEKFVKKEKITPHAGWAGFIVENIFEMFEVLLSFVTNTMSYLRVGGFVLSHAGMMLVVMTLNEMTGRYGIFVLIIGNIFVIGLEGLIVGIQTLRLEYYEMFSRYFRSGGKKFRALKNN